MIYLQLFLSFLQIGCLSFGGGYAAMPLIQEQVVDAHHWLTMEAFTNLVTIAEMTPGPIAVNGATFVGTQVAGLPGAIAATAGCVLPSCIFVTLLACIYMKYRQLSMIQGVLSFLRPAVVAMIAKAGVTILTTAFFESKTLRLAAKNVKWEMVLFFAAAIFMLRKLKWNPVLVMVLCGGMELAFTCAAG